MRLARYARLRVGTRSPGANGPGVKRLWGQTVLGANDLSGEWSGSKQSGSKTVQGKWSGVNASEPKGPGANSPDPLN